MIINQFKNPIFSCDAEKEYSMLVKLFGWNIEDKNQNFNFYTIYEDYNSIKGSFEMFGLKEFDEYLQADWYIDQFIDSSIQGHSGDSEMEEEKLEQHEWSTVNKTRITKCDINVIPTNLYLNTPDHYFTLPTLPKTIEELTKKYYKKKCAFWNKLSRRGAICLSCGEYLWVGSCEVKIKFEEYLKGNLTKHSAVCGAKVSIFIGAVEGQLIYIYDGLSVEFPSPYVNKYGECYDEKEKSYDTYTIVESKYNQVREHFLDFSITDLVVRKRSNKSRVYIQNIL